MIPKPNGRRSFFSSLLLSFLTVSEALQQWRAAFKAQHQREPRLWIDKYCIDQTDIEAPSLVQKE